MIRLRSARPRDARALGRILSDWIDETHWMPRIHTRAQDRAHMGRLIGEMDVTVATFGLRTIGFLARRGHMVHALYLSPTARGRGIGCRLLEGAKAANDELTLWTFEANDPARRFYRSNGFVEVERTEGDGNDEGLPDVRLYWRRRQ